MLPTSHAPAQPVQNRAGVRLLGGFAPRGPPVDATPRSPARHKAANPSKTSKHHCCRDMHRVELSHPAEISALADVDAKNCSAFEFWRLFRRMRVGKTARCSKCRRVFQLFPCKVLRNIVFLPHLFLSGQYAALAAIHLWWANR